MNAYQEITRRLEKGPIYLFTVVSGASLGEKVILQDGEFISLNSGMDQFWSAAVMLADLTSCPYQYEAFGEQIFVERMVQEPELVICGGGHISQELAFMADYLEYPYTVLDDREEFANRQRFPKAKECICRSFKETLEQRVFSPNAYYVIVTRGHAADLECLELILKRPYGYVGMIGSRGKVKKTMDTLKEKGFTQEQLEDVHAPIGLPIGGETPREIAISIIAQLIQKKNADHPASYIENGMKEVLEQESSRPRMLLRIIGKRGSAPRGIGSRMIVLPDGNLCGTIGGGMIEYKAVEDAADMLARGAEEEVRTYRLNTETAGALGMWCGGEVDILFESC